MNSFPLRCKCCFDSGLWRMRQSLELNFTHFYGEGGQPFLAAIFTPVVHFSVGGLDFDEKSAILGTDSLCLLYTSPSPRD